MCALRWRRDVRCREGGTSVNAYLLTHSKLTSRVGVSVKPPSATATCALGGSGDLTFHNRGPVKFGALVSIAQGLQKLTLSREIVALQERLATIHARTLSLSLRLKLVAALSPGPSRSRPVGPATLSQPIQTLQQLRAVSTRILRPSH